MTNISGVYTSVSAVRSQVVDVARAHVRHVLLALTVSCMLTLAALTAAGAEPRTMTDGLGAVFAVAFVALTIVDFRSSVGVAIFELVLGGATGNWVDFGGGLTGRIFVDAVVTAGAVGLAVSDWRKGRRPLLGRYGTHALAIALVVPAIWIPLGLVNGNRPRDVVADGDGFIFFAFVLVVVTLIRRGDGAWFRRLFFVACATSAATYFFLVVATRSGVLSLETVREWLSVRLAMGGVIGYMPNGDYRLFTAGSLFLLVGLVLATQRLLVRPRDVRFWLLAGMFGVDLVATYTRGLWLAALVGVGMVVVLQVRSVGQLGLAVAIPAAVAGLAVAAMSVVGVSLYGYVAARASTIIAASQPRYPTQVADPSFETSSHAWRLSSAGVSSLRVRRTESAARAGRHSLELSDPSVGQDAYVFENLRVKPGKEYSVGAWVDARALRKPAAGGRGLVVWDSQKGSLYTVRLTKRTHGWRRLSFTLPTHGTSDAVQIRLYAPQGRVLWDRVHFAARSVAHGDRAHSGARRAPKRHRHSAVLRAVGTVVGKAPRVQFIYPRPPSSRTAVLDPTFKRGRVWQASDAGAHSLRVRRTAGREGVHSLELSNWKAGQDAFVFQNLTVTPNTKYEVSARVNARALRRPAAGGRTGRGLLAWDAQDGRVYTAPLTRRTRGWSRLSLSFTTRARARYLQIRLYAPKGRVLWRDVHLSVEHPAALVSAVSSGSSAAQTMALTSTGTGGGTADAAGEASNAYKIAEAKALLHYVRRRPIYGYGFGSVATNFTALGGYSYELSYLDLLFKTGILGLLLYLSFPTRLIVDALRLRRQRSDSIAERARALSTPGVVVGVVVGILLAGATNPYLFAAFGVVSILAMVAWLEPLPEIRDASAAGNERSSRKQC